MPVVAELGVDAWHDLFVATAGAAAGLAGLIFVAVSINIERILAYKGLPERALQTVVLLLGALVVSVLGLAPQQVSTFGWEVLVTGLVLVGFLAVTGRRSLAGTAAHPGWILSRLLYMLPGSVLYVVGGVLLVGGSRLTGMSWVVAGLVGAFVGGVLNGWVLLVEILR